MAYSKTKKILFILLCLFVILFPFWCVRGLCAETENVEYDIVNNLSIYYTRNYFNTSTVSNTGYFELEKGYIYYITKTTGSCSLATSNDIPDVNVLYDYIGELNSPDTFSYISDNSNVYLYFCFSNDANVIVTREKIQGQVSAVQDLVDNVGINSIWSIFDISINYIVIVVVFALGCFIIFKLIKKVSKGKEGF